jgi:hypothetical protein
LEKRDWEQWTIVSLTSVLAGAGLLAIFFPAAFLKAKNLLWNLPCPDSSSSDSLLCWFC